MKGPTMHKYLLTIFGLLFASVLLTGCAGGSATPEAPPTLNGTWSFSENKTKFNADVRDGGITMSVTFNTATGLYWKGTFPQSAEDDQTFSSVGDTAAMKASMFGSKDPTKQFTYSKEDDTLTFDFSMLGVTKPVTLSKTK